jgi:hypothetical protein
MLRFAVSLMLVAFGVIAGASVSRAMELDGFWMDSHG